LIGYFVGWLVCLFVVCFVYLFVCSFAWLAVVCLFFVVTSISSSGFHVSFVSVPEHNGFIPRFLAFDAEIQINTMHPEFTARLKSQLGQPKFTHRLCAYLSVIIATQYNAKVCFCDDDNEILFVIYLFIFC
jgi:hypothetical protein